MLTNVEIVHQPGQDPAGIFDFSKDQADATAIALTFYQRMRFAHGELEIDDIIKLREFTALSDQLHRALQTESHVVLRTDEREASLLSEVVFFYIAKRDVESYQSPDERARLALMKLYGPGLRDLASDLRAVNTDSEPDFVAS